VNGLPEGLREQTLGVCTDHERQQQGTGMQKCHCGPNATGVEMLCQKVLITQETVV
jgi:hypothetical protein